MIASSRDAPISLSDVPAGAAPLFGVIVFAGIVSLLGYGLGLIIRNTPASVAVLLVWPLVVEGLVAALLGAIGVDHPAKFLPYNSGIQLGNPDSGHEPRRALAPARRAVLRRGDAGDPGDRDVLTARRDA